VIERLELCMVMLAGGLALAYTVGMTVYLWRRGRRKPRRVDWWRRVGRD
jgi:hypothetical protein